MTQAFTPSGGMNQDDSIITPTANAAGRNAFGLGDYKYALNSRIGSSKSDNFGDLEILKGTVEVTNYKVRSQILSNSDFSSGLTGWSQLAVSGGTPWTVLLGDVVVNPGGSPFVSDIIYPTVFSVSQRRVGVKIDLTFAGTISVFSAVIHFLNGPIVMSSMTIISDSSSNIFTNPQYSKYLSIELPVGCTAIGVQIFGIFTISGIVEIKQFKIFDWIAGSRPSGTDRVIGKYENKEFNLLFYHVWNNSNNHCIRYYDPSTNAVYELLKWSGLAYGSAYFVSSAMIDNYLAFTDRNNSPRLMDIYSVSDLSLILGSDFREYHISFHKWAPIMPPVVRDYYDGVTNNYAKFQYKTYQFSYRYIYQGNLKSRWSPISASAQEFNSGIDAEITSIELFIPGFTLDTPGAAVSYNYFDNDNVKFTLVVKEIELAFRESSLDLWRILKRYDVKATDNKIFRFIDGSNSVPVATNDFIQPFDAVPFLAGAVEAIDNRFMFGDILDEKETAPPVQVTDVAVVKWDPRDTVGGWWNFGTNDQANMAAIYTSMSAADAGLYGLRVMINDTTFKGRGLYKTGIQYLSETGWRSGVYTAENWIYEIPAETSIVDKIYALGFKFPSTFKPPKWAVSFQIMRTNCLNIDYFMFGSANQFIYLRDDTTIVTNGQTPADIRDRSRQHFEGARLVTGQDYNKYLLTLDKKPFYKSVGADVRKTVTTASLTNASRIFIDVNNWWNASSAVVGTTDNPMNKLFYNFREGDRVRFLGSTISATPTDPQKTVFDVPILEFNGLGILVEKPVGLLWLPADFAGTDASDFLLEVYTPKVPVEEDYIFYESGEWYPILYPGTEDRDFSKRDWTYTNNASITCSTYGEIKVFNKRPFAYGDCSSVEKRFYFTVKAGVGGSVGPLLIVPSMNPDPSRLYDYWEKSNGRPSFGYTDLPVVKFKNTQIRFGGQIVEESFVNNINRFRDEDNKIFPSEYGRIRAMVNTSNAQVESVGAILFVIGERESFSIYINRTTLEDLSGRSQVALSDRILGSYNTLLGSHGTLNPESVSLDKGHVYYWDALDGTWIRYGRDGLTEISFYKMRNWFRELSQLLINTYSSILPPVVISEFDPYNEELVMFMNHYTLPSTFRDYSTYKGAMFSEDDKRWKSVHSYEPEMFGRINTQFVSFKDGSLYLHEQNATRSTFYGTKYDVMIEPVFNTETPKNTNSWQNIAIIATHGWSVERFLSEYRGANTKQQSSLTLAQFEQKEDGYYAAIKNDQNTPNRTNPIITGEKMRSKAIRALLKLDPSVVTESLLHYVEVGEIDSPKNP